MNIPESFKLDRWYNLIALFSAVVFFGTLFKFTNETVPVVPTLLVSLGFFAVGIGEMINHIIVPLYERVGSVQYKYSGLVRKPSYFGIAIDIIGIILIIIGIYKYF